MSEQQAFEGWAVIELLGHRRLGAYVREATIAGHGMLRLDVPGPGGAALATQYVNPSSLYALTPCTEDMARAVARRSWEPPVQRYELAPAVEHRPRAYTDSDEDHEPPEDEDEEMEEPEEPEDGEGDDEAEEEDEPERYDPADVAALEAAGDPRPPREY